MGIIMAVRAFAEIPMMLLLNPPAKATAVLHHYNCIQPFVAECVLLFVDSFAMIVLVSVLHGIGNGFMLPTSISYVFPCSDNLKTTSQTSLHQPTPSPGFWGVLDVPLTLLGIKQFYLVIGLSMLVILVLYLLSFGKRFWHKARFESLLSRI